MQKKLPWEFLKTIQVHYGVIKQWDFKKLKKKILSIIISLIRIGNLLNCNMNNNTGFITSLTRSWLTRSFRAFRFTNANDRSLPYQDTENLGLYIHIPFCRSLCDFCPYCKVVYRADLAKAYVAALKKEIELVGASGMERKKVTTLYFGGGSPALLADEIRGIVETVGKYFEITEGIGLELHPSDVTEETLRTLHKAGVTRISIGIQSFSEEYLEILGRGKLDDQHMFRELRSVPFETVSMDFIFALPGQTFESVKQDIDTAFANGANHIAIYPFIDFTYTKRKFEKMPEAEKRSCWRILRSIVTGRAMCGIPSGRLPSRA